MPLGPETITAFVIGFALLIGSLACGVFFIHTQYSGSTLIPLEERRQVPWGGLITAGVVLLSAIVTVVGAGAGVLALGITPDNAFSDPVHVVWLFAIDGLLKVAVCIGIVLSLRHWLQATSSDFGLKTDSFARDLGQGVFMFGVVLLPLFAINFALREFLQPSDQHQVFELLQAMANEESVWYVCILLTVVVAPLTEEFFFRGFFQGYLERIHGPRSWMPVLISSVFFAAVHINGDSPDPIALFFFALALGFLYRQTHRLWPCVVLHMSLNALSMAGAWFVSRHPELAEPPAGILNYFSHLPLK